MANQMKAAMAYAKKYYKAHPSFAWKTCVKEGWKHVAKKPARKKSATKKHRRVSGVKKVKRAAVVRKVKRLHKAEGRAIKSLGSVATTESHLKKQLKEQLAWGMLQHYSAKGVRAKKKIAKRLAPIKRKLNFLTK